MGAASGREEEKRKGNSIYFPVIEEATTHSGERCLPGEGSVHQSRYGVSRELLHDAERLLELKNSPASNHSNRGKEGGSKEDERGGVT